MIYFQLRARTVTGLLDHWILVRYQTGKTNGKVFYCTSDQPDEWRPIQDSSSLYATSSPETDWMSLTYMLEALPHHGLDGVFSEILVKEI